MTLQFYDTNHTYELNGQIIPSVSQILRFLSREVYGNDAFKYQQDLAAERGTAVHKATAEIDETGQCEIDDCWAGYLEAYVRFLREHDVCWTGIESALAEENMLFAGTFDRFGVVDGNYCILDIKTNATICKPLVKAQLCGYKHIADYQGIPVQRLYCLQLLPTGKYRLYPVAIDDSEFMWCYNLHYSMKRKHGRGRVE